MKLNLGYNYGYEPDTADVTFNEQLSNNIDMVIRQSEARMRHYFYNTRSLGSDINYLFELIWHRLYAFLPETADFKLDAYRIRYDYSAEQSNLGIAKSVLNFIDNPDDGATDYKNRVSIRYYYCYKGSTALFDTLDANEAELNRLKNVDLALITDRFHKVRVYIDNANNIRIVSNKYDPETSIYKVMGLLPACLGTVKEAAEKDPLLYNFFKTMYECDTTSLEATVREYLAILDKEKSARAFDDFAKSITRSTNTRKQALQHDIETKQQRLRDYYRSAQQIEDQIKQVQLNKLALELSPAVVDEQALALLKRGNPIVLNSCNDTWANFTITTPITNYNIKDVEMWYKHPETTNSVLRNPWLAKLIHECFIEEKYQAILTTTVAMPWDCNNYNWDVNSDDTTHTGNPHLTRYQCFSQTQNAIASFLREGKVLQALNALIACCASIAFTDSSVVEYFTRHLMTNGLHQKIFKNLETGEMFSPDDYKKAFEAEEAMKVTTEAC